MLNNIAAWEGEGGSLKAPQSNLTGTVNQIEWAERIRMQVIGEFDRVANLLETSSRRQSEEKISNTRAIIAILEDIRIQVLANDKAGYFIHDWQEPNGQVRKMILSDARYKEIKGLEPVDRSFANTCISRLP